MIDVRWVIGHRVSAIGRRTRGEGVQDRHLRIRDGVSVVIAIDRTDVRLAAFEVERLDLKQLSLDDVDRFLVEGRGPARETRFADHLLAARDVDYDEVVGRYRSEPNR